ncbi:amidohydrolase family protein [Paractinoplanes hotanensis]|uniref:Amidohydrolase family protein n=1 Tax=Paractinoplanes hotanensis TaxID=2906497 RepID=A0ABT0YBA3_9ACTN|nr:amidohydrolase family protein [Actinoplanes hotanensis]MCM4082757.1 amidohydrolase family protein [Actinoplanes hotanensis]
MRRTTRTALSTSAGLSPASASSSTRRQALRAYTRGNAWYLSREKELGSIERGRFADLVVLDRDYFPVSDAAMRDTRPVLAVIGGRVVHDTLR